MFRAFGSRNSILKALYCPDFVPATGLRAMEISDDVVGAVLGFCEPKTQFKYAPQFFNHFLSSDALLTAGYPLARNGFRSGLC